RRDVDVNHNGFIDTPEDRNPDGIFEPCEDLNGNGVQDKNEPDRGNCLLDPAEDANHNGILDTEDLNHNGVLDPGEDKNGNGILDTEDKNGNGRLDLGEDRPDGIWTPFCPADDPNTNRPPAGRNSRRAIARAKASSGAPTGVRIRATSASASARLSRSPDGHVRPGSLWYSQCPLSRVKETLDATMDVRPLGLSSPHARRQTPARAAGGDAEGRRIRPGDRVEAHRSGQEIQPGPERRPLSSGG